MTADVALAADAGPSYHAGRYDIDGWSRLPDHGNETAVVLGIEGVGDHKDVVAPWTPVDAILRSRTLSNILVFGMTGVVVLYIRSQDGTIGVVTSAGSIVAIGGGLYGVIRLGRWYRDVKPQEPKAHRKTNDKSG